MEAKSFRYSCRVLVAMETNLSDLCAAFSALMILVSRNLVKLEFLENRAEAGMGGPNMGTFLDRDTAILKLKQGIRFGMIVASNLLPVMSVVRARILGTDNDEHMLEL